MGKKKKDQTDEMLDFDPKKTVSFTECTGLIQTPVTSDEQANSYQELYDVYQPDGDKKPLKKIYLSKKNGADNRT